jgi:NAD(P)-dependent dehydrogenase (short-subunit alcohol dehydrogenase family)
VIPISSWAGQCAGKLTAAAHNVTKRSIIALNETNNMENGGHGIRSTAILPGEVATDFEIPPQASVGHGCRAHAPSR